MLFRSLVFENGLDVPGSVDLVVTAFNRVPYENTVNVIAPDGAYMLLESVFIGSGGDEILDFGELGYLYSTFENVGQDPSGDLTFTLFQDNGMVTMIVDVIEYGSVSAGEEITIDPFEFQVSWNVEDGAIIPFVIQVTDGVNTWEYESNIPVEAPDYNLISVDILDSGNGTLDPGETTSMQLVLTNIGHTPVNYPTFEATTSDPNIMLGELESDNA